MYILAIISEQDFESMKEDTDSDPTKSYFSMIFNVDNFALIENECSSKDSIQLSNLKVLDPSHEITEVQHLLRFFPTQNCFK